MKSNTLAAILPILLIIGCTKKAVPVITGREASYHKPLVTNSAFNIAPDTLAGRIVFNTRCGKCHGLPEPAQFTAKRWERILSYMIPKARLSEEQGVHITAYYLKANAPK